MSGDSRWSQTERDEDAYEDAWYRALKAKASNRFADRKDDTTDAPPAPVLPPAPTQNEDDARAR